MSTPSHPAGFSALPRELQIMVWEEAIVAEYADRVVPVLRSTQRVVLTAILTGPVSKYFHLCSSSREAAQLTYNLPMLAVRPDGEFREARLSTALDIFLVSPWQYTLGINANSWPFQQSIDAIHPNKLSKIKQVMEHHLDLTDLIYHVDPTFDRALFQSVKVCFIRLDHQRPTIASLAGQLSGPGPHTGADLLEYCTQPSRYDDRAITEEVDGEEMDQAVGVE
ncbi:hypothetical protein PG985_003834 [Apiospora marii]|uniref:uncharacterized protein n=1 Tax=Apiospora marii TaxID=335849 RepID=UPI00313078FD